MQTIYQVLKRRLSHSRIPITVLLMSILLGGTRYVRKENALVRFFTTATYPVCAELDTVHFLGNLIVNCAASAFHNGASYAVLGPVTCCVEKL